MSRLFILMLLAPLAGAHDIPNDVQIRAFFHPQGRTLRMLVRVPTKAMRDVNFPLKANGFLDADGALPLLRDAAQVWIAQALEVFENDARLRALEVQGVRLALESDTNFGAQELGPALTPETNVAWQQTFVDVLLTTPIQNERSAFSLHPAFARLGLSVAVGLGYVQPDGTIRAFEFHGDPGVVRLDPRWHQAAWLFIKEGLRHILSGTDHLLFLFALVLPYRRIRALLPIVTAFTVAHSVTLIASAYDLAPGALWFSPLIETLIAVSILYMALENIVGTSTVHRRWLIAFGFGLVHGFGFSFALKETLQFAGAHLLTSLLSFNIGIELGQLLVLMALVPVLEFLFRKVVAERIGIVILSAFIAHTAWHWFLERATALAEYRLAWPEPTVANGLRGLMLLTLGVGLWRLLNRKSSVREGANEGEARG